MRIRLSKNFFIEQCSYAPFSWDLYLVSTGIRKGETVEVEKPVGCYGVSLDNIVTKIADYQLQEECEELNIEEYIERFKKIQEEAIREIKKVISKK